MLFHNQDLSSLENATHAFWCQSKLLLNTARTPDTPKILGCQLQLSNLLQLDTPDTIQDRILDASDLATTLIKDLVREDKATSSSPATKISEVFPRQGRPAAGPCPSFKKGDEVILAVKTPDGQTAERCAFLGRQDMMTGCWYVMTPDWQGYAPEKSIRHAPKGDA